MNEYSLTGLTDENKSISMRTLTRKEVFREAVFLVTISLVANIAQSVKIYQPRKGEGVYCVIKSSSKFEYYHDFPV